MSSPNLTVVVPVYNEEPLITRLIDELNAIAPFLTRTKILIVDDGSTDGTAAILASQTSIEHVSLPTNLGKGAAVRVGISRSHSSHIAIFDGDLEYSVNIIKDFDSIVAKIDTNTIVFASRYIDPKGKFTWRVKGQRLSSILANALFILIYRFRHGIKLTDTLTGAKMYPRGVFSELTLSRVGFEADHEIAMKLGALGKNFVEIPIEFKPRTKAQGKKINSIDGIKALIILIRGENESR